MIVVWLEKFRDWMFRKEIMHYGIIFWGQMLGQGLFAFMNINIINGIADVNTLPGMKVVYTSIFYSCSMFINISYGREFTGGVYNPAIIFFRVFRRTDRLKLSTAFVYWGGQFLGSCLGCLAAFYVADLQYTSIMMVLPIKQQMIQSFCEAMGTFILALMVQYGIEKKMTFVSHNKQLYIWLPLLYLIARGYSAISNGVNPAFGLGYELGWCLKYSRWDVFPMTYILVVPPFIGAGVAVAFFEMVVRPFFPIKQQEFQLIIQQMKKHRQQSPSRKDSKSSRLSKFNRRVTIGEVHRQNEIQLPIPLADYYNFRTLQKEENDYEDIDSLDSGEQDRDDLLGEQSRDKMLDDILHRIVLDPSIASQSKYSQ